jgi:hypothetical protein
VRPLQSEAWWRVAVSPQSRVAERRTVVSKRKGCKHIKAALQNMVDLNVYVLAKEAPRLYCDTCKAQRELNAHGNIKVPA